MDVITATLFTGGFIVVCVAVYMMIRERKIREADRRGRDPDITDTFTDPAGDVPEAIPPETKQE